MKPRAKQGDEELEVFNGLRVICCALIVLGNTYFYILRSPLQNLEAVEKWLKSGVGREWLEFQLAQSAESAAAD